MQLLLHMAIVDGKLQSSELDYLAGFAEDNGIQFTPDIEPDAESVYKGLTRYSAKIIVLQEIIKLSVVDNVYSDEERHSALQIAQRMGLTKEVFEEVESWIIEGRQWLLRGIELLCEPSTPE
ncbi:hypothetical protein D5085_01555 [Ectothiorhodospiraceae bacterium BW-2]|nr:hypothetical protein D5085_01555 [Ectothiorhodospiraceae bacterium BW-2]